MQRRKLWYVGILSLFVAGFTSTTNSDTLTPKRNRVDIAVTDAATPPVSLRVAILSDMHIGPGGLSFAEFETLLTQIKAADPDILFLLGDFTVRAALVDDMEQHRQAIVARIHALAPQPLVTVLGNHDSWTDAERWLETFDQFGLTALENSVEEVTVGPTTVCVRGLGDHFTRRFHYVEFPEPCDGKPKITLTHDPAGAFDPRVKGLIFSGHTHCGQVKLPYIPLLWVPSEAPLAALCGLYRDEQRTLFVSAGSGTSILPIRVGTQSSWDLIDLSFGPRNGAGSSPALPPQT